METDAVEFREQNNALLLVWIGLRNKRHATLGCTQVVRQMRYAGRNVNKVPGLGGEMFFQSFAIPRRTCRLEHGWPIRGLHACVPLLVRPEEWSPFAGGYFVHLPNQPRLPVRTREPVYP
jgi:hypothetical protein